MEAVTCSIKEVIRTTSLSQSTIYRMIDRGELETVKLGGRRLVKIASLKRLLGESGEQGNVVSSFDGLLGERCQPTFPSSVRELRSRWPKC